MWRLKYLIYGMIPPALLGVALYFLVPAMTDWFRDSIRDSASHAVETSFQREVQSTVTPGQIVITELQLEQAIENADRSSGGWSIDGGVQVKIQGGRISILTDSRSNNNQTIASGVPQIQEGQFKLTDRKGVLSIFKPARDAIGDEIENQVADLFSASNVQPVSVTAENGRLVIVTESLSGGTSKPLGTATPQPTRSGGLGGGLLRTPTPTP